MVRKIYNRIIEFTMRVTKNHVSAYASQSAFFLVLSMIPFILMLLTLIQFTLVTKADVMDAVMQVFPKTVYPLIVSIVNQLYNQSQAMLPFTALVAFWSAGRGVLAMSTGLNCVYDSVETRNYIFLRIRAALYTLFFVIMIIMLLVLLVFGDTLSALIKQHIPYLTPSVDLLISIRLAVSLLVMIFVSTFVYKFLPNRKVKIRTQLPGAVFTAFGWAIASYFFSVYVDVFKGFSDMYGSMTTIVIIMLWLYFLMYIMLLGGLVNVILEEMAAEKQQQEKKLSQNMEKNG